jgi:hypothetical protein
MKAADIALFSEVTERQSAHLAFLLAFLATKHRHCKAVNVHRSACVFVAASYKPRFRSIPAGS